MPNSIATLAASSLGEFDAIKDLPGMVRAAVNTLDKVWRANIDLSTATNPRLMALHTSKPRRSADCRLR